MRIYPCTVNLREAQLIPDKWQKNMGEELCGFVIENKITNYKDAGECLVHRPH